MLTSEQKIIVDDVRWRLPPYPGVGDRCVPTGVWFHEFIKPAAYDPSLRLFAVRENAMRDMLGMESNMAVIMRGNPYAVNSEGHKGAGILTSVRTGTIPPKAIIADMYFRPAVLGVEKSESANELRKDMRFDGWTSVTEDLIRRGVLRPTLSLQMLLGTAIVPA
jgi:hypothetical protein